MKRTAAFLCYNFLLLSTFFGPAFAQDITVKINGKYISFMEEKPYINKENRTMVPLRLISEILGSSIIWDVEKKQVIVDNGENKVILTIDSNIVKFNDQEVEYATPQAEIVNGRTMVPLRMIAEANQAKVEWNEHTFTVEINKEKIEPKPVPIQNQPDNLPEKISTADPYTVRLKPFKDIKLERFSTNTKEEIAKYAYREGGFVQVEGYILPVNNYDIGKFHYDPIFGQKEIIFYISPDEDDTIKYLRAAIEKKFGPELTSKIIDICNKKLTYGDEILYHPDYKIKIRTIDNSPFIMVEINNK